MLTVDYEKLELNSNMSVLDLGAGLGRHAFESARKGGTVFAVDLGIEELTLTQATFAAMYDNDELATDVGSLCIQADATGLPFLDNSFDRVIASEVLEHISDDIGTLDELSRIVKPSGRIAVTVPATIPEQICWWLNDSYHAPRVKGGHLRIYSRTELETKLRAAGFEPYGHHKTHALHSPYWWLKCIVGLENDSNLFVKNYLKLLTWDITDAPVVTRFAERALNPILGKSLVVYAKASGK